MISTEAVAHMPFEYAEHKRNGQSAGALPILFFYCACTRLKYSPHGTADRTHSAKESLPSIAR